MKTFRRLAVAVAVGALAAGLGITAAAPASAATQNITVNCTDRPAESPFTNLIVSPGDTIVIDGTDCDYAATNSAFFDLFSVYDDSGEGPGPYTWVISTQAPPGTYGSVDSSVLGVDNDIWDTACTAAYCGEYFYITIPGGGGWKDLSVWYQSVARAGMDDMCDEGWSPSYEMWPNDGMGGWVCSRGVPMYDN